MIGLIDSGMGGLTTLAALLRAGCDHAFCYYADVRNAPYGNKPRTEVMALVRDAVSLLEQRGAERVVLACNTASLVAKKYVQRTTSVGLWGVEPPIAEALRRGGKTLLVGTTLTVSHYRDTPYFRAVAMPSLATLIDRDYPDTRAAEAYCRETLAGVDKVDNLILGCTHYVLIKDILRRITGARTVLDGNEALAEEVGKCPDGGRGVCIDVLTSGKVDEARYKATLDALLGQN